SARTSKLDDLAGFADDVPAVGHLRNEYPRTAAQAALVHVPTRLPLVLALVNDEVVVVVLPVAVVGQRFCGALRRRTGRQDDLELPRFGAGGRRVSAGGLPPTLIHRSDVGVRGEIRVVHLCGRRYWWGERR